MIGSNSQMGIGIGLYLHDHFSGKAKQVNQELLAMRKNAHGAVAGAIRDYRNQAATISAGALGISAGLYNMAQSGAEFQHRINQVAIVGGKDLKRSREDLSNFARDLSKTFSQTPTEVASAMFENVKAGLTQKMEDITKYQIAVSTATDEALGGEQGVAHGLISIMNAMDLHYGQFARVANAVTSAANSSQASVLSLNESMQYFANTAHMSNLTLEETLALVAKLSQSGIRGSSAGTALSNMLQHMVNAVGPFMSKKQNKAWGTLGIDPNMVKGLLDQGKIFKIIELIDSASRNLGNTDKLSTLNAIFGVRGEKALINTFGSSDPTKTLSAFRDTILKDVQGDVAMKQSKAMMNDLFSDMKLLTNGFERFKNSFITAAGPTLRVLMKVATGAMNVLSKIMDSPLGKIFAGLVVTVAPMVGIMFALRAAALTATLALRSLSMSSSVGGFRGMMQSGLGLVGMGRFGQYGGQFTRNAAGRMTVAAGQTVNFGNKTYRGGQMLPQAFATSMGLSAMGGSAAAGLGSKVTGFMGKAGPWLGRIAGFGARWLPVVGWIWTGFELVKGIYGLLKGSKDDEKSSRPQVDPMIVDYYRQLDLMNGNSAMSNAFYQRYGMSKGQYDKQGGALNQQINIYQDGKLAMQQTVNQNLEEQMNAQLNFNLEN